MDIVPGGEELKFAGGEMLFEQMIVGGGNKVGAAAGDKESMAIEAIFGADRIGRQMRLQFFRDQGEVAIPLVVVVRVA